MVEARTHTDPENKPKPNMLHSDTSCFTFFLLIFFFLFQVNGIEILLQLDSIAYGNREEMTANDSKIYRYFKRSKRREKKYEHKT